MKILAETNLIGGLQTKTTIQGKTLGINDENFEFCTDYPTLWGGTGEYATPFSLFLAGFAACQSQAFAMYCQEHEIPTEGFKLRIATVTVGDDEEIKKFGHEIKKFNIFITLPKGFPEEKIDEALYDVRHCKISKNLFDYSPDIQFNVTKVD